MNKALLSFLLVLLSGHSLSAEMACDLNKEILMAEYTIDEQLNKELERFELLRMKDSVVQSYPEKAMAQLWHQTANKGVVTTKFFAEFSRAIEYAASDVPNIQSQWQEKNSLVSPVLLQPSFLKSTDSSTCYVKQHFYAESALSSYDLLWNKTLQIPESLLIKSAKGYYQLKLVSINSDAGSIASKLNTWLDYPTVDFADIGDNESDPFLRKMINLGFVEHGASGFYNDKGQIIKDSHTHH